METLLSLDFGTGGVKALLSSPGGRQLALRQEGYPFSRNQGGHMEQDPQDWWRAAVAACAALRQEFPGEYAGVCAIGLCAQMHGPVLLDGHGEPVGGCITWCDTRCAKEAAGLQKLLGEALFERLQNPASCAYTAPKLLWLLRHEPERMERAATVLFCKDYIRYRLTGELASDHTDASGSLLYDFETNAWSDEAIRALGLRPTLFPGLLPSFAAGGSLCRESAAALALPQGIPVAVGAGDLACSVLGSGLTQAGEALLNLGTAGQVLSLGAPGAGCAKGSYLFSFLSPGSRFSLCALPSAAYCLRWFLEQVGELPARSGEEAALSPFARLDRYAAESEAGARGVLFAPYLNGTGSPYFDEGTRGAFLGLGSGHTRQDLCRALLEGVGYGVRDCFEALGGAGRIRTLCLSGGGARSGLWRQILADILGHDLLLPAGEQATAAGACRLAYLAACGQAPAPSGDGMGGERVAFRPAQHARYEREYRRYRRAYPLLRQLREDA